MWAAPWHRANTFFLKVLCHYSRGPCISLLGGGVVTKHHKLGAFKLWKLMFSQFWRLEV